MRKRLKEDASAACFGVQTPYST